jgi:hypothetical protein
MKFIIENTYSHGRIKVPNHLNRLLHELLGLTLAVNLTIFFCEVNIFLLLEEICLRNHFMFYYQLKISKKPDFRVPMLLI